MFAYFFMAAFFFGAIVGILLWLYTTIKNKMAYRPDFLPTTQKTLLEIITWSGIVLILIGWVKGMFSSENNNPLLILGIFLTVGGWIVGLYLKVSAEEKIAEKNKQISAEKEKAFAEKMDAMLAEEETRLIEKAASNDIEQSPHKDNKKKHHASFLAHLTDDSGAGWILKYQYERDLCLYGCNFDDLIGQEGEEITFRQEPENTYDPNAVAVYLDDKKVGYVFKGRTQDMTNDWLKRSLRVGGLINDVDETTKEVTYRIAYYVPDSVAQSKIFPLVATSKKDFFGYKRSENMVYCEIGDDLVILEDYDTYTVYNVLGNELGELGAGFRNWADKITYDTIAGVVDDIYDDENGNTKMKVKIMLI